MRRTPEQDIKVILEYIEDTFRTSGKYSDCRYLYVDRMSDELCNILTSMGVSMSSQGVDFRADDATYIKALNILKMMIEDEWMKVDDLKYVVRNLEILEE